LAAAQFVDHQRSKRFALDVLRYGQQAMARPGGHLEEQQQNPQARELLLMG
jgi:hypothetical protein